jgi:hypothetical protein
MTTSSRNYFEQQFTQEKLRPLLSPIRDFGLQEMIWEGQGPVPRSTTVDADLGIRQLELHSSLRKRRLKSFQLTDHPDQMRSQPAFTNAGVRYFPTSTYTPYLQEASMTSYATDNLFRRRPWSQENKCLLLT